MKTLTFPVDKSMPSMEQALDGAVVTQLLNRHLEAAETTDATSTWTPYYVKYKPGKYCVVQYRSSSGETVHPRQATISLYPPARAEKMWARVGGRTHALTTALYLPDLRAIVQLFPYDRELPGLTESVSAEAMSGRLRTLPTIGEGIRGCEVELVRYKAMKRAVLRYTLQGARESAVYGKLRKDGGPHLPARIRECRRAGVLAPEVLGEFEDLGIIVQAEGRGTRLKDLRVSHRYDEWMEPTAAALARLHDAEVSGLTKLDPASEVADLETAAESVGFLVPELAAEAERLAERIAEHLRSIRDRITRPIHGSFHDDQLLVGETGVVMIDLDSVSLGHPLADVGHFLSYLDAEGSDAAAQRFVAAYGSHRPVTAEIHLFEAASLLRWATLPFRELRPAWPDEIARRVELSADRLQTYER